MTELQPQGEPVVGHIAAEADDYESDSAIGADDVASSTTSIGSSVLKYREENGRTYHAYKVLHDLINLAFLVSVREFSIWHTVQDGAYAFPNDEVESDRLDLQHAQFTLTFDGRLFTAPLKKSNQLQRVLDVGTGTGIWAIDFADDHPESTVLGIDLSPIQPSFIPPNVTFEVDDLEQPWTYTQKFDLIYSRMMIGSFANVPQFVKQAFDNLAPGGTLEMADILYPIKLNDGEFPVDSAVVKWCDLISQAMQKVGRRADCARLYKQQLIDAGFTDVVEKKYIWPSNRWPKDKKLKELGNQFQFDIAWKTRKLILW